MPDLIPYLALLPYAAVALSLLVTLMLFLNLKYEIQRSTKRERKRVDALLARLEDAECTNQPEPVFVPVSAPPNFNLNRRAQASRMLRRGDEVSHIAAALNVPQAEIELVRRVEELTANPPLATAAGTGA